MELIRDDGGRASAGFQGATGDCVVRAVAIATGRPYQEVYDSMWDGSKKLKLLRERGESPREGVRRKVYDKYLRSIGWSWTPTMSIGSGCKVHLKREELPGGRIIARLSRHLVAVVDGKIHDTYDCSRGGTRCVYGYYSKS